MENSDPKGRRTLTPLANLDSGHQCGYLYIYMVCHLPLLSVVNVSRHGTIGTNKGNSCLVTCHFKLAISKLKYTYNDCGSECLYDKNTSGVSDKKSNNVVDNLLIVNQIPKTPSFN